MATQIEQKTKQNQEMAPAPPRGGALRPFGDFPFFLSRMRDEFDQLFHQLARHWVSPWEGSGWRWGLDVRDEDNAVVVRAEAPGFEAGDFDIQVSDNRLVLRAARKVETKEGKTTEHREQTCYESVTLPPGTDKDKVEAKYHNGILTVTFPKTAEGKTRRVPVKNA
jgi:HSP20 family protein